MTFTPSAVRALRCPICQARFELTGGALRCAERHSYDLAKQGYVNLLGAGTGDNKDMVTARSEFLAAGHYRPLADLIASRVPAHGLIVDAGTGTGYYLAAALEKSEAVGLGLDTSTAALRRAARAHPDIAAVVWDLWRPWPVESGAADVILNIFAPRNPAECARVLRPGGTLLVVTPTSEHLAELRAHVGILAVEEDKLVRLDLALSPYFSPASRDGLTVALDLSPDDVRRVVHMGPNAYHADAAELAAITDSVAVTASFVLSAYRSLATS